MPNDLSATHYRPSPFHSPLFVDPLRPSFKGCAHRLWNNLDDAWNNLSRAFESSRKYPPLSPSNKKKTIHIGNLSLSVIGRVRNLLEAIDRQIYHCNRQWHLNRKLLEEYKSARILVSKAAEIEDTLYDLYSNLRVRKNNLQLRQQNLPVKQQIAALENIIREIQQLDVPVNITEASIRQYDEAAIQLRAQVLKRIDQLDDVMNAPLRKDVVHTSQQADVYLTPAPVQPQQPLYPVLVEIPKSNFVRNMEANVNEVKNKFRQRLNDVINQYPSCSEIANKIFATRCEVFDKLLSEAKNCFSKLDEENWVNKAGLEEDVNYGIEDVLMDHLEKGSENALTIPAIVKEALIDMGKAGEEILKTMRQEFSTIQSKTLTATCTNLTKRQDVTLPELKSAMASGGTPFVKLMEKTLALEAFLIVDENQKKAYIDTFKYEGEKFNAFTIPKTINNNLIHTLENAYFDREKTKLSELKNKSDQWIKNIDFVRERRKEIEEYIYPTRVNIGEFLNEMNTLSRKVNEKKHPEIVKMINSCVGTAKGYINRFTIQKYGPFFFNETLPVQDLRSLDLITYATTVKQFIENSKKELSQMLEKTEMKK